MSSWSLGKIQGTVFRRSDSLFVTGSISIGKKHITRNFYLKNYDNDEQKARKAAEDYIQEQSEILALTKTSYKEVGDVVIVQLTNGFVGRFDLMDLPYIKENPLFVTRSSNQNAAYYAATMVDNEVVPFHRFILRDVLPAHTQVDHINRCTLDNRRANLRWGTSSMNNSNRTCKPRPDGLPIGVERVVKDGVYYRGRIGFNNQRLQEWFSVQKYGEEEARRLAIQWREKYEWETGNTNGTSPQDAEEYESFMKEHCSDIPWLKWSNRDPEENARKDALYEQTFQEARLTAHEKIYIKFREVWAPFGVQHFPKSQGSRLVHIEHPETKIPYKWCGKCKRWRLLDAFGSQKNTWDGLPRRCKDCLTEERARKRRKMGISSGVRKP